MLKRLLQFMLLVSVGAMTSVGTQALAAPPDDATSCPGCVAGIGIWNQVIDVYDSNGNACKIIVVWWRKDGICIENPDGGCVEADPCKYICATQSTCANPNGEFSVQVSSPGGLNFSTWAEGSKVVGAPYCGWATQFNTCAVNLYTGAVVCRVNWAGCSACTGEPVPPDATGD